MTMNQPGYSRRRFLSYDEVMDDASQAKGAISLESAVTRSLEKYFENLDGYDPLPLYAMVISTVEKPLLVYVMKLARGNKCEAARLLGINRNTLHTKLKQHNLI